MYKRQGYAALGIELTMLLACFFRNRRLLPPQMKKIIRIMPPVIIIMTVFQLVYPELLMNGLITALCFLIIFISFQNSGDIVSGVAHGMNAILTATLVAGGALIASSLYHVLMGGA